MKQYNDKRGTLARPVRRSKHGTGFLLHVVMAMGCMFGATQAWAHGALANRDTCILTVGPYTMYFSGYIPKKMGSKKFCDDLPMSGHAFIVMDFIQDKLRSFPVELTIVRNIDIKGRPENDGEVVFHKPLHRYPNGTIEWDHDFPEKGYFVGIVKVIDRSNKEYTARFPFGVGTGGGIKAWLPWMGLGLFVLAGIGGTLFWLRKTRRESAPEYIERSAP